MRPGARLFHRDRLREAPALVDITPQAARHEIGEQLEGDVQEDRIEAVP